MSNAWRFLETKPTEL